jgi:carboxymethylenebutenolidase
MCFDHDSRPPIAPIAGAAVDGEQIELVSEDRTPFFGFEARAAKPSGAAMLILPDVRGCHRYYEELALRFAEAGIDALAIDYFGRTATTTDRGADFDYQPHVAALTWPGLLGDSSAGALRLRQSKPRAVFSVGFCMGGRLSFDLLTRPSLGLAGAIGFYGWPAGEHRTGSPAPIDVATEMHGALLAFFGGQDKGIPREAVTAFDMALDAAGVDHEVIEYPDAPHSFFDRKYDEFAEASADAWQHVLDFVREWTPPATD